MIRKTFQNPLLCGFYPDPSICRVGEDYYMVTSSFVYYPGIPIFHSRDLIHWEQIGHGIERPDQLDYKNCETSLGLWAPTIRYHKGTFYIINTFVSEGREARRDNYIITAADPAGPWSDPVFVEHADGIDSSLFFDDDDSMWYVGNFICPEALFEGHHGIYLCELDPKTFQFKGERHILWDGNQSRNKWLEAPHIYKKDGYYYLLAAEGGTFVNHSVMMARCSAIDGIYEICPRNPVVTHRHLSPLSDIAVTGHADIVETQNGEWWMVLLAVRPYQNDSPILTTDSCGHFHYNLGRETFMAPVIWDDDGWLRLDNETGLINQEERLPDLPASYVPLADPNDDFESDTLAMIWNTIHPPVTPFYSLSERKGFLRLKLSPDTISEITTPSFVGRRQQHKLCQAKTAMEFAPAAPNEEAGLVLLQDDRFNYIFTMTCKENQTILRVAKTEFGTYSVLKELPVEPAKRIYLSAQCNDTVYCFYYGYSEREMICVSEDLDAALLSSTVNGGFTGTYMGMYASSNGSKSENYADFDWFHYFH